MVDAKVSLTAFVLGLFYITLVLSGCSSCKDGKYPKDEVERMEREGVNMIGVYETFSARIKVMKCKEADDGIFGGSHEEVTVVISCGEQSDSKFFKMETGEVERYGSGIHNDGGCFYDGLLEVHCRPGDSINVKLSEDDTFSSSETGGFDLPWDMIRVAYHGQLLSFSTTLKSTGKWDRFWQSAIDLVGGICITDFLPVARHAARALKLSHSTVKMIHHAKKHVRNYEKVDSALQDCYDATGAAPCGDAKDVTSTIWDAQCFNGDPDGGTYVIQIHLSTCAGSSLNLISVLLLLISMS